MIKLDPFRNKNLGFCDLLNYAAVVDDGIVLLKSGALMASWVYRGPDVAALTPNELNSRAIHINNALLRLGTGWMTQHDVVRIQAVGYPQKNHFPDKVSRMIDKERELLFKSGVHFENRMVVTLTYLPPTVLQRKFSSLFMSGEDDSSIVGVGKKNLNYFQESCKEFEGRMRAVCFMSRLQSHKVVDMDDNETVQDNQLRFIQMAITGDNHPISLPSNPMYLDCLFGQDFRTGFRPLLGEKYIGAITIDGFPQATFPGILRGLDEMYLEYRWSNRFIYEDSVAALKLLNKYRLKWQQKKRGFLAQVTQNYQAPVDEFAEKMEANTNESIANASSGEVTYGYYTSAIIIRSKNLDELEDSLDQVRSLINSTGFNARIEGMNAVEAYLGSLPGHAAENVRRPSIHTLNLSDLLPLNTVWPGKRYNPCPFYPPKSPPWIVTSTNGSTPFRLNLHHDDLGHTMVIGPTGSGKSTFLGLLAAQFLKYPNASVFVFDQGYSMYPLVSAITGGKFFDIGEDDSFELTPLADLTSQVDLMWAEDWLVSALKLQGVTVTPQRRNAIRSALVQHRDSEDVSLHDFRVNLQDREATEALEKYTVSDSNTTALLDGEKRCLELGHFNVFELFHLMEMGEEFLLPVITYIFHTIDKQLKGQPATIIIDEAWIALGHEVFRRKIREWLKVLRKANAVVVLATQSISDASASGILDVLADSCPSKIFLPNPAARDDSNVKFYTTLGLNTTEIDLLASATQKRDYYYRGPEGRRLFGLDLGPYALSILGNSGKEDIRRIRELKLQYGEDNWLPHWQMEKGVEYAN